MADKDITYLSSTIQVDGEDFGVVAKKLDNTLTITTTNGDTVTFDGSSAKTLNIEIPEVPEAAKRVSNKLTIIANNNEIKFDGSEAATVTVVTPGELEQAVADAKSEIVNGAEAAYDTLKELSDFINDNSDAIDTLTQATTYSNDTPIVNALGGVAAGTTFDNMPITEVLTKILYPYVAPAMGSTTVTRNPSRTVLEYGETQIISGLKVSVQKKSDPITSIKLIAYDSYVGESIEEEKTGDSIKNGGVEIPFTKTFTIGTKIANKFYNPALKFRVTDGTTTVDSSSISTTFVYPYYYGAINADAVVSENIIKNLKKEVVQKGDKTWAFTLNNQKAVFAYPKSYGALKSIINQNNYEVINTFTRSELSITGLDGTAQTYYVYVSNGASTISDFKYTFDI